MSRQNRVKLNHLLTTWRTSTISACSWLHKKGVGYDLLNKYRKRGWLKAIGNGAVARAGDKIDWSGGLYTIQEQLKLPIHVGGKTALLLRGYSHFIPQATGWTLFLFSPPKTKLPTWFKKYPWGVSLRFVTSNLFASLSEGAFSNHEMGAYSIRISSLERAIFELLSLVPQEQSFEEATLLMEGLTTLRPKIVQKLLQMCNSIKVKRLFLFLAETCNHPWVQRLNLSDINLGKGKRLIEKNGVLNIKYGITVPKNLGTHKNEKRS